MFYYLLTPIIKFNFILIAAAVIPAVYLMVKVYRIDRLEPESPALLKNLVVAGILSSLIALVAERILWGLLDSTLNSNQTMYNIILYFGVVAISEECSKYFMLKRRTWENWEFNCFFDGLVYAVFVSLGFALWENISYVLNYGLATAVVRAFTAIPGHACFGVFMGVFYASAKKYSTLGDEGSSIFCRILSILAAVLIHGAYDYIATMQTNDVNYLFFIFIAIMFIVANIVINRAAKADHYIQ